MEQVRTTESTDFVVNSIISERSCENHTFEKLI